MRDQDRRHADERQRADPRRDLDVAEREVRVRAPLLDALVAEQQEDPDAGAQGGAVEVEDVALEQRVEATGESAEGAGEEDEGYERAVRGFEAVEEGEQGQGVEEEVREGGVQEGVGVEAVDWRSVRVSWRFRFVSGGFVGGDSVRDWRLISCGMSAPHCSIAGWKSFAM